ncbi:MAG: AAA family ATPase [Planctomycetota bacterium JB042]
MKEPDYVVDGILPEGALAAIYGRPKTGKTFVAIDLVLSVVTGRKWMGRTTKQGPVVYVAAEGGPRLRRRFIAWEEDRDRVEDGFYLVPEPVRPGDPDDLEKLRRFVSGMDPKPRIIVLDTVARCILPGDENSNHDMSNFVEGLGGLQREFGCTVLLIHHTGHEDSRERGASALRGAVDTLIRVRETDRTMTLTCEAQKDDEPFAPIHAKLRVVELDEGRTSCVVDEAETVSDDNPRERHELMILEALAEDEDRTRAELLSATDVPEGTLAGRLIELTHQGLVEKVSRGKYRRTRAGTEEFKKRIAAPVDT